jgi:Zonular occludens toxin (Zot)
MMLGNFFKRAAPAHFAEIYKPSHDGRFHLYEARRGRGKSYTLTDWALTAMSQGVPVVANYEFDLHRCAYELMRRKTFTKLTDAYVWLLENVTLARSWDDVFMSYNCLVIIDEVNRTFNAAGGSRSDAPPVAYEWLQQSRKFKQTIIFAAQGFDWLPPRVRQLADILWRAKREDDPIKLRRGERTPIRFYSYGGDPWASGLSRSAVRDADMKFTLPFRMQVARCYRSFAPVAGLEDEPSMKSIVAYWDVLRARGVIPATQTSYTLWDLPLEIYCSPELIAREEWRQRLDFLAYSSGRTDGPRAPQGARVAV